MKSTGIVRNVDDLGRIVIPKEIRRTFGINNKDALEILTQDEEIILRKFNKLCIFCGSYDNLITFKEKMICEKCKKEI